MVPFLLVLVLAASPAGSAVLHKCVDARGVASYQSQPCGPGQSQAWSRPVPPEPLRPVPSPSATPTRRVRVVGAGGSRVLPPARRDPGQAACRAAREADARYRQRPLSEIRFDDLRRLGDAIHRACR